MFYKGQMVTSADFYEGVAALNGLTLLYEDVLDGTCVLGYDVVLVFMASMTTRTSPALTL